jgi:predicted PurR-regulated permease PerM
MHTLPQISDQYQGIFKGIISFIKTSNWSDDIKTAIFKEIGSSITTAQNYIMSILKKSLVTLFETITMFFDFGLAMVIAYYFIKDAEFFKETTLSLAPRRWRNGLIGAGRDIHRILSKFIQGQLLTAMIVGTLEIIGLVIVGVKYPFILGCIGGIANIIPYFGPFIGAVPAVAIALIDSPMKAVWTIVAFSVVQQIDNSFISPKIIEGGLGLHPVTTILVVLIGGEFFGILGMLIAVPVAAIIKALTKRAIEAIV